VRLKIVRIKRVLDSAQSIPNARSFHTWTRRKTRSLSFRKIAVVFFKLETPSLNIQKHIVIKPEFNTTRSVKRRLDVMEKK